MWMVQAGMNAGGDMAPWYKGAVPTGFLGIRWISSDNNDSIYTCWNDINDATYRNFTVDGVPTGHDNYNYVVSTWSHRFDPKFITTTEAYFMYERDAVVGGTPNLNNPQTFDPGVINGPGGPVVTIPGWSYAYGVLNYTAFELSKKDYVTVRNEIYRDETGFRTGYDALYTSNTIGISHNFNSYLQIRPEIGYYRSYINPAFDNGTRYNQVTFMCDFTMRF